MSDSWFWAHSKPLLAAQFVCLLIWFMTLVGGVALPPDSALGDWCRAWWWVGLLVALIAMLAIRGVDFVLGRSD